MVCVEAMMMPQPNSILDVLILRGREALIRGAIWGFVGVLYAILFVSFGVIAEHGNWPINPTFLAAIMAGTISALMYSSMRLAVLMALLLFPLSIFYFTQMGGTITLVGQLKVMMPAGILIGAFYGLLSSGSRIHRADAKTLAGFSVGILVGLGYLLVESLIEDPQPIALTVGILCPLTGALYVSVVPTFIRFYHDLLPPMGDGALVGACIAVFISFCSFLMAGSVDVQYAGALNPEVARILDLLPAAVLGGVVGAGTGGVISGLLLFEWQDL
jgi:hypothetical protein